MDPNFGSAPNFGSGQSQSGICVKIPAVGITEVEFGSKFQLEVNQRWNLIQVTPEFKAANSTSVSHPAGIGSKFHLGFAPS